MLNAHERMTVRLEFVEALLVQVKFLNVAAGKFEQNEYRDRPQTVFNFSLRFMFVVCKAKTSVFYFIKNKYKL